MLALPFSFSAAPYAMAGGSDGYALLEQALLGEQMQQGWREYARARIVPEFDWADRPVAPAPDLMALAFAEVRRSQFGNGRLGVSFESSRSRISDFAPGRRAFAPLQLSELTPSPGLRQEIFSPGVVAQTRLGQFEVGAVFAYQRFASWDFGAFSATEYGLGQVEERHGRTESSFGQGVRVGMTGDLGRSFGYRFDYRSKIDMDAFNSFRGVYAQPGDFDLPATLAANLDYRLTPNSTFSVGMEQIRYSEIDPFLSSNLPNRFLALLGDGASPEFRWDDLTVYSAEWRWQPSGNDLFALRYSTRQQPSPTSAALQRALANDYTDQNYAFAYVRRLTPKLQLGFAASYAPASYFLGQFDPLVRGYETGEQVEAELLLTALF